MNQKYLRNALGSSLVALTAAATLTLTGCSDSFTNPLTGTSSATQGAQLSGNVHGGRQPISNATVTVYAFGKNGYGSAGAALATTTTDVNGNFSFGPGSGHTYACPAANSTTLSQSLYIVANGGNPNGADGSSNAVSYLMTVLQGNCNTVITTQPQIVINELTTVASMFALQQFFTPGTTVSGTFGTSATNNQGLLNAIATAGNLIALPSGIPVASSTVSGAVTGYATAPTVTITPDEAKLDTMADILAACVNTNGASTTSPTTTCGTLFSDVASPAVNDTLQAAYYLATNPTSTVSGTSNISALYNLATPASPYQPTLTAAPADWTVGISYGTTAAQTVGTTPVYFLTDPEYVAVDSTGNLWVANYATGTAGAAGNSVVELSPNGTPLKQVFADTTSLRAPKALIIDPSNNVYVTNYGTATSFGTTVAEYTAAGASNFFTTGAGPGAIASDGSGNIFLGTTSATNGGKALELIPANSASGTTTTKLQTGVTNSSFSGIAVDANETVWLTNATSGTNQFLCSSPTTCGAATLTTAGGQASAEPDAIDGSNNVWVGNYSATAGSLSKINATKTTTITGTGPYTGGGVASIQKIVFDGAGNVWSTSFPTTAGTLSETSPAGVALSPTAGFYHGYKGALGLAIDLSGNVWVGNYGAGATATTAGFINEIVGAAAPVVTPTAAGLPTTIGGASRLATRP